MKKTHDARRLIVTLLAIGGLALTGCAAGPSTNGAAETAPAARGAAGSSAEGRPTYIASLPTGDVGTGTLVSSSGTTAGSVRFSSDGTELTLHIEKLSTSDAAPLAVIGVVKKVGENENCIDTGFRIGLGQIEPTTPAPLDADLPLGDMSIVSSDPSGINQVLLTSVPATIDSMKTCVNSIIARADISWTFAPLRSFIKAVDTGETGGARGSVAIVNGAPDAYVVVGNDLINEVAARFGLTVDDLFYLNNARLPNPRQQTLRVGERLNLSLANR